MKVGYTQVFFERSWEIVMNREVVLTALALLFSICVTQGMAGSRTSLPKDVASGWGNVWLKSMENGYKPYGFKIVDSQTAPGPRFGKKFIKFEVRPGDCGNNGGWDDCANDRERHELSQNKALQKHGDEYWYSWSIFVPTDTPSISPTKVHLGQFQQKNNNVLLLMSWSLAGYYIDNQVPGNGYTRETRNIIPQRNYQGKWQDILIHTRWSHSSDGFFKIYHNHKLKYEYAGQTIAKGDRSFFKFGIYRSFISRYKNRNEVSEAPKQIVYYDEVHRNRSLSKVDYVGIAKWQEKLAETGHYTGKIDGLWGGGSLKATNAWLTEQGYPNVREYSPDLWRHMIEAEQ
ncbi:MAG TPA: hypothetical protein DCS30_13610 [Rhizobiales bacterium]|nr:hypothetical protein [Hyphomicrobiales bacterium]